MVDTALVWLLLLRRPQVHLHRYYCAAKCHRHRDVLLCSSRLQERRDGQPLGFLCVASPYLSVACFVRTVAASTRIAHAKIRMQRNFARQCYSSTTWCSAGCSSQHDLQPSLVRCCWVATQLIAVIRSTHGLTNACVHVHVRICVCWRNLAVCMYAAPLYHAFETLMVNEFHGSVRC